MTSFPRVALAGGTANLGHDILDALLAKPYLFSVTVLTRCGSSSSHSQPPQVKTVEIGSYTDETPLITAVRGHDVLLSVLPGAVSLQLDPILLSAAVKAGVKRFLPSDYTLDVLHPKVREVAAVAPLGARTALADRIVTTAETGQIEYTSIMTVGLLDWALEHGFGSFNIPRREATLYDDGVNKCTACTTPFVAQAVVAVLQMPEAETRNRRIGVAEVEYSGVEMLEAMEKVTGQKWNVKRVSTEALLVNGRKALVEGNARAAYVAHVVALNFDGSGPARFEKGLEWNRDGKFSVQRKSLQQILREAVERN